MTGNPRVTRTDLKTGKMEILVASIRAGHSKAPTMSRRWQRPPLLHGHGGCCGLPDDASGKMVRILAAPDIERPNGIQVSPDDKTLYLIEANGAAGGARMIRAYDLQPDGTVRNMRVHYNFYPGRSADGMSIDTQGNLYASAGLHQLRGTPKPSTPSAVSMSSLPKASC